MLKESGSWGSSSWTSFSQNAGGSVVTTGGGSSVPSGNFLSTFGVATPNYRARVRRGDLIPFTPFWQYELTGQGTGNFRDVRTIDYPNTGSRNWVTGNTCSQSMLDITKDELAALVDTNILNRLVQQSSSRLYSKGFDALTFLAEFKKTLDMFKHVADKLRLLRASKPPGTPWNLWLEGRYGWRTLIFDLKGLQDALTNFDDKRTRYFQKSPWKHSWTTVSTVTGSDTSLTATGTTTKVFTFLGSGKVLAEIAPPKFAFNPLTTAWELVRFSFVVDWFVNVGQALEAMSFMALQQEYAACQSAQVRCEKTYIESAVAKPGWVLTNYAINCSSVATYNWRQPCSVSILPQINVRLNAAKITDVVSLVLQAIRRL